MRVPLVRAARRNASPKKSGPFSSTGMVTEMTKPRLRASRALMAWYRRLMEPVSAIAAPSMSKSRWVTWYLSITLWYARVSDAVLVQDWASSAPAAPPKAMMVLAPARSARAIFALTSDTLMFWPSPQMGVHPTQVMNEAVELFTPAVRIAVSSMPSALFVMSTYGVTAKTGAAEADGAAKVSATPYAASTVAVAATVTFLRVRIGPWPPSSPTRELGRSCRSFLRLLTIFSVWPDGTDQIVHCQYLPRMISVPTTTDRRWAILCSRERPCSILTGSPPGPMPPPLTLRRPPCPEAPAASPSPSAPVSRSR